MSPTEWCKLVASLNTGTQHAQKKIILHYFYCHMCDIYNYFQNCFKHFSFGQQTTIDEVTKIKKNERKKKHSLINLLNFLHLYTLVAKMKYFVKKGFPQTNLLQKSFKSPPSLLLRVLEKDVYVISQVLQFISYATHSTIYTKNIFAIYSKMLNNKSTLTE